MLQDRVPRFRLPLPAPGGAQEELGEFEDLACVQQPGRDCPHEFGSCCSALSSQVGTAQVAEKFIVGFSRSLISLLRRD